MVKVPAVTADSSFVVTEVNVTVASAVIVNTTFTPVLLVVTAVPSVLVLVLVTSDRATRPFDET